MKKASVRAGMKQTRTHAVPSKAGGSIAAAVSRDYLYLHVHVHVHDETWRLHQEVSLRFLFYLAQTGTETPAVLQIFKRISSTFASLRSCCFHCISCCAHRPGELSSRLRPGSVGRRSKEAAFHSRRKFRTQPSFFTLHGSVDLRPNHNNKERKRA